MEELNSKKLNETSDIYSYNCAGYALGEKFWFDCNGDSLVRGRHEDVLTEILEDSFTDIRIINSESELKDEEDLVYFRLGYDEEKYEEDNFFTYNDFHFVRKFRDIEEFWHKCGISTIEKFTQDIYDSWEAPGFLYEGKITLLAIPKENKIVYNEEKVKKYKGTVFELLSDMIKPIDDSDFYEAEVS